MAIQRTQRIFPNGMDIVFPNVTTEPLYYGKQDATPFDGFRAIVDQSDKSVLTVVSEQYRLIRHEDMIEALEIHLRHLNMAFERKVTMIKQGARMMATYTLPEITVRISENEILSPTIIMKNSYDLSWVATIMGGVMRLVCSNGAYMGTMFQKVRQRHVGWLTQDYLAGRLEMLSNSFHDYVNWYKSAIAMPISTQDLAVIDMFDLNKTEASMLNHMKEKTSGLYLDLIPIIDADKGIEIPTWTIPNQEKFNRVDMFNLLTEFTTHKVANTVRQDGIYEKISRHLMY